MSKPEVVSAAITQAGTFVLPPQAAEITTDDTGTVYADGQALTPVHCPGCNCEPSVWRSSCAWCRREYDRTSEYDYECCSQECEQQLRKDERKRADTRKRAEFNARLDQGKRVCKTPTTALTPCMAPPLLGADVCIHHADESIQNARRTGIAWGQMAVNDDLCVEKAGQSPGFPIIDAYRRDIVYKELLAKAKAGAR